jgi:hypothetical protein
MPCDEFRQFLLDTGWDASDRARAAEALRHVENCQSCRDALAELDRLRQTLGSFRTDAQPAGGWEAFERRLLAGANPRVWRRPPIMAIAASVLIVGGLAFFLGRWSDRPTAVAVPGAEPVAVSAQFAPQRVSHEVNAFAQVSQVFDGRASWLMMSNAASDVGLSTEAVSAQAKNVLLLRLTLTRSGAIVSDADLLVVPGQSANLTVPLEAGQSLHYRIGTSTDEPTRLSVWLEVKTPAGEAPLAALATNLRMRPGERTTAGQLSTTAGEYELRIAFSRANLPGAGQ